MRRSIRFGWLLGMVLFVLMSVFRIAPGETAAVMSGERVMRNNLAPGWHMHRPWLDTVDVMAERRVLRTTLEGGPGQAWALVRVTDAARLSAATRDSDIALQTALSDAAAAFLAGAAPQPAQFNAALAPVLQPLGLVVEDAGISPPVSPEPGDMADARTGVAAALPPSVLDAATRGAREALRVQALAPAYAKTKALHAEGDAAVQAVLAPPAGTDPGAAEFDRAAQQYRRARLAGQRVSLDEPRFAPLRAVAH